MCDFLRDAYTDDIRPYAGADLVVARRWYKVGDDAPVLEHPSAFLSEFSEAFPYLERAAGVVWPTARDTTRRTAPAGLTFDHVCGTAADFAGEGVFDPTRNVVYDDNWLPECCGVNDVCTFNVCSTDDEHGWRAAQLLTYPVPHQVATGLTPAIREHWGLNFGNNPAGWPGYGYEWHPGGTDNPQQRQLQVVADENGALQFQVDRWTFGAVDAITRTINSSGYGLDFSLAGDVGGMALEFVDGVLSLVGSNFEVAKSVLPADVSYLDGSVLEGGTAVPMNPTPIPPGTHDLFAPNGTRLMFQLVAVEGAVTDIVVTTGPGAVILPPAGERFTLVGAVDAPLVFGVSGTQGMGYRLVRTRLQVGPVTWLVEVLRTNGTVPTSGTVTSVGISTSSAPVTVGGGPVTGSGTLTVDVAQSLLDLHALAAGTDLVAGDGAGGYSPVSIGPGLDLTANVLSAPFVYPATGRATWATFAITGASNVFQATGNTVVLPAAGTYNLRVAVRGELQSSVAGVHFVKAKLRNVTAGADVTDSEVVITGCGSTGEYGMATAPILAQVVAAGATTVELYAARVGAAFTVSQIQSDANGRTVVEWERVA